MKISQHYIHSSIDKWNDCNVCSHAWFSFKLRKNQELINFNKNKKCSRLEEQSSALDPRQDSVRYMIYNAEKFSLIKYFTQNLLNIVIKMNTVC